MQDIPRHRRGGAWARRAGDDGQHLGDPALFPRARAGRRLSIQAGTKYIGGHSDIMFGTVVGQCGDVAAAERRPCSAARRLCVGPDDVFLGAARLAHARPCGSRSTMHPASRSRAGSSARPEVARVLHPALESRSRPRDLEARLYRRRGLFSIVLKPAPQSAVYAFLDALTLFGMGYSWGGFESLAIPFDCASYRTATMGAGRPDAAVSYRARGCRRPRGRSRARLRGVQRGVARLKRRIQRTAALLVVLDRGLAPVRGDEVEVA